MANKKKAPTAKKAAPKADPALAEHWRFVELAQKALVALEHVHGNVGTCPEWLDAEILAAKEALREFLGRPEGE